MRAAVKRSPETPKELNNLAWLLATCADVRFRDPPRAVELAKKAVVLAPQASSYWHTLGVAQYRVRNWEEAIKALDKCRDIQKWATSYDWFFLAMCHWQLGQKAEARKWHDAAVKSMEQHDPQNEELQRFRAESEALLGITKK